MAKGLFSEPTALIVLTGALIGGSFVLSRALAVAGLDPAWMLLAQSLVAGVGLAGLAARRGGVPLDRRHVVFYLLGGLTSSTLPRFVSFIALQEMSAGLYSMLVTLSPLLTWLVASAVAARFESMLKLAGVLLGFAGIAIVLAPGAVGDAPSSELSSLALALGLATPALLAIGNVYRALNIPRETPALAIAAGSLLAQVPVALAIGLAVDSPPPTSDQLDALLAFGAWTLVMSLPYYKLQAVTDAVRFSQIGYVIPVTGIAGGAAFLGETLPATLFVGAPLIMLGLAVTNGHLGFRFPPRLFPRRTP